MNNPTFIIILLMCLLSCSNEETQNLEPSKLQFSIENLNEGDGQIAISASAVNITEFRFILGDGTEITNETGQITHVYETTGTYEVEIRAYGQSERYVKETERIYVLAEEPINIGQGYSSPLYYEGMTLIWSDEFSGNFLNSDNWSYDLGDGCPNLCGWGNNELEYYTKENSWVEGGTLIIEARKEQYQGSDYTSTKLVSLNKQSFQFGRVDIRAILPKGQGIWPALWMLGTNITSVGWPRCGEIDIMEMVGGSGRENKVTGNVFWHDGGKKDMVGAYVLPSGTFNDEYHVFSIIWDENAITWYVDDESYHTFDITPESRSELRNPFYFIMNVAVGGNYPGNPDNTSVFPTQMKVDYIRVFQEI